MKKMSFVAAGGMAALWAINAPAASYSYVCNAALRQSRNFRDIGLPVGVPVFRNGSTWTVACVRVGGINGTVNCTSTPSM